MGDIQHALEVRLRVTAGVGPVGNFVPSEHAHAHTHTLLRAHTQSKTHRDMET